MKMISSTKLVRAQKAMETGRIFGESFNTIFKIAETKATDKPLSKLLIACSSDRGLCGGVHSSVSKLVRKMDAESTDTIKIAVLGDKAKPQIARSKSARKNIKIHFGQIGRMIPTFTEAAVIADVILKQNLQLDAASVVHNNFKNVLLSETRELPVYMKEDFKNSGYYELTIEKLALYEYEDAELENFFEFTIATQVFWGLVEGHVSEMAARRTAMENASKNANEIIHGLTLKFNRTRQAFITNELVDIITGASAL